jgi:crotonobetainyl-CoA:carnitine CoA-transferase CaiB-like acyl-CoA transferase
VYQAQKTRNGYIAVAAVDKFADLCKAIGREDLARDPRYSGSGLTEHKQELLVILDEIFLTKSTDEWLKLLTEADVPCGPVNTLDKAFSDPQVLGTDRELYRLTVHICTKWSAISFVAFVSKVPSLRHQLRALFAFVIP